jgi:tRNA modification GTPase
MEDGARWTLMTALRPGAVAVVQLHGAVEPLLAALTGIDDWPEGRMRLVTVPGIDEALAVRLEADCAQVMPHGGVRVVQRLLDRLGALGAVAGAATDAPTLFPEAADECEAMALETLGRAASPLAVDLLLDQPRRWRERPAIGPDDRLRSARLDRLVDPPWVVLAGPPNVGKSTLSNALLGRAVSIAMDRPGTTRDYTAGRLDLGGLVVRWHDTPGLRASDDPVEAAALGIARRLIDRAELLVAATDAAHDWPALPREADLRIATRADLGTRPDADLAVSAVTGAGLNELVRAARDALVPPEDLTHPGPWVFDPRLG